MKKPDLIIHIGPHKTGTTSLQNYLKANHEALLNQGIYYPTDSRAHHYLPKGFIKGKPKKKAFAEIANKAQELKAGKVIFSSEAFSRLMNRNEIMKDFAGLLKENFETIKVICYVRSQYERTESALTQIIKTKPFDVDVSTYVKSVNLNYLNISNFWINHFGEGSFKPILYSRDKNNDVLASFCRELGITNSEFHLPETKNIKPELDKLRLIFYYNQQVAKRKNGKKLISAFSYDLIKNQPHWEGSTKYKIIPFKDAQDLENRLSKSNESFREKFFPNQEVLFPKLTPYQHDELDISNLSKENLKKAFDFLIEYPIN